MRRIWDRLPGPLGLKVIEAVVLAVAALVVLFFLFEWGGGLLDSGGAIG
ncbi:MAG: hypothetical protein ACRDVD_09870 [Acidimicrobiia bacterium]